MSRDTKHWFPNIINSAYMFAVKLLAMSWMTGVSFLAGAGGFLFTTTFRLALRPIQ
jgi:hypothetical protein